MSGGPDLASSSPAGPGAGGGGEAASAAQLHQTLVVLRAELVAKNEDIKKLRSQLKHQHQQSKATEREDEVHRRFHAMFEEALVVTTDEEDVDEIISYADLQKRQEKQESDRRDKEAANAPPTEDPIMAFVLSEGEEESAGDQGKEQADVPDSVTLQGDQNGQIMEASAALVPNEDIVFHVPPKRPLSSAERPVLRSPAGSEPRSCSGSQTDITALRDVAELGDVGGRYSLVNRDLTPRKAEIPRNRPDEGISQHVAKVVRISNTVERLDYSLPSSRSPTLDLSITAAVTSVPSNLSTVSDSLESLLCEASNYLKLCSKGQLLDADSWKQIDEASERQRRIRQSTKRPKSDQTALQQSDGTEYVGVETKEAIPTRETTVHLDWKRHFQCASGNGALLPLRQIVMCMQ